MFAPTSLAKRLARPGVRLRRLPVPSRVALGVLVVVVLGAVLAPLLTQDPLATGVPAQPPGADHWFGTDRAGRDVFARVVHGARYSLVIGLGATLLALVLGGGGRAAGPRPPPPAPPPPPPPPTPKHSVTRHAPPAPPAGA
ncbi:hypothetical protein ACFV3O_01355, partial [Streptomyces albidoflavus]